MKRFVPWLAGAYFVAMTIACTFPALSWIHSARPFVLGLPFPLVWFVGWVIGSMAVFALLYWSEQQ